MHFFAPVIRAKILTSVQDFFIFNQPIKIFRINMNFDSRAKAPPAKRSEKGYGDENGLKLAETGV